MRASEDVLKTGSRRNQLKYRDDETGKAFSKERDLIHEGKREVRPPIPLDLHGYLPTGWERQSVGHKHSLTDFQGWESSDAKFKAAVEKVIQTLRADEHAREQPQRIHGVNIVTAEATSSNYTCELPVREGREKTAAFSNSS